MDVEEHQLLEVSVRDALAAAVGDAAVESALRELGWLDMLAAEARDAIDIVFTALGAANANGSTLDDVMLAALGIETRADRCVVLPRFGSLAAPGSRRDGAIDVSGLTTRRAATAREFVVVVESGTEPSVAIISSDLATFTPAHGVDPDAGLHTVRARVDNADAHPLSPAPWNAALALGRRAIGYQTAGACRTMLDLARAHALERIQFNRAIAGFQAVRHRLADALVAIESLDAALIAAADEAQPITAALAKAIAGRSARTVAGHCQQVLAGVGFTTEHAFHRYWKRTMLLDGLLGSADALTIDIGRQLLAARHVPTLIEL